MKKRKTKVVVELKDGRKFEVVVDENGQISSEAFGFKGPACEKIAKWLDSITGGPTKRDFKTSYYEKEDDVLVDGLPSGWCG